MFQGTDLLISRLGLRRGDDRSLEPWEGAFSGCTSQELPDTLEATRGRSIRLLCGRALSWRLDCWRHLQRHLFQGDLDLLPLALLHLLDFDPLGILRI
jgi:hypothetical protein